ncbi:MAG: 50S ribosomal protein L9 [Alphaproteobacteria bacterium]|nr:50S ribosomal protein L9 [Alphaproteobacteria bacterium]MCL2505139.1 50S ribosomal protein L9 [Alphaproteobacteria bacterium]
MEVILLEKIERLGVLGQTVKVRPGFARNYLLPKKKALRATKENLAFFEKQRADIEASNAELRVLAEELGKQIQGMTLVVVRQASEMGQLFGSVTAKDVVEIAEEKGYKLSRLQVLIDTPIKTLGLFDVRIKLHPEVTVTIVVNVARSAEEAEVQAKKEKSVSKKAAKAEEEVSEEVVVEAASEDSEKKPEKPKRALRKKKAE